MAEQRFKLEGGQVLIDAEVWEAIVKQDDELRAEANQIHSTGHICWQTPAVRDRLMALEAEIELLKVQYREEREAFFAEQVAGVEALAEVRAREADEHKECDEREDNSTRIIGELRAELARERNERDATADMLREARAEVERLRAEMHRLAHSRQGQRERAERAEAEVERLRAAIEAYLESDSQANWDALAALVSAKE